MSKQAAPRKLKASPWCIGGDLKVEEVARMMPGAPKSARERGEQIRADWRRVPAQVAARSPPASVPGHAWMTQPMDMDARKIGLSHTHLMPQR